MCCSTVHFLTLLTRHQEVRGWTSWNSYILIKLYAGSRYVSKTSTAFCNSTVSVSMTASYKCTNNGPGNHTAALSRDPKQPYNIYIIFRPVAEQKTRWLGVLFLTMGYEWIETTASFLHKTNLSASRLFRLSYTAGFNLVIFTPRTERSKL